MIKYFLIILFINLSNFAQTKGFVVNIENKPIPYVTIWVENEEKGTTSQENGSFTLQNVKVDNTLIFSALGYETQKVKIANANKVILKEIVYELEDVTISSPLKKEEITIGDFDSGGIRYFYISSLNSPTIIAKYIPYTKQIADHNYIKSISFYTKSKINIAKVNLQFLEADEFGHPGKSISKENIIVNVKKGDKITLVNVENLKITIPENGIFVMIESLIIAENNHIEEYVVKNGNKKSKYISNTYQPNFGFLPSEKIETWKKTGILWKPMERKVKVKDHEDFSKFSMKKYHDKYLDFPIKLVLTN